MGDALRQAEAYFKRSSDYASQMPLDKIAEVAEIMFDAYRQGKKFFFMGNGGSFATASHACIDFLKGTSVEGKKPLKVVALTDPSVITALGNDIGFENIFKYQLEAHLEPGDLVVGISASGNSPNIVKAVEYANEKGAVTVGWLGFGGGKLKDLVKHAIVVLSEKGEYGPAEDLHLQLDHFFVEYLKKRIKES